MSTNFIFHRSRSTINLLSTISTLVILENSTIVDFSLQIIIFQISDLQLRSKSLKKYCRQESTKKSTINNGGVINR